MCKAGMIFFFGLICLTLQIQDFYSLEDFMDNWQYYDITHSRDMKSN